MWRFYERAKREARRAHTALLRKYRLPTPLDRTIRDIDAAVHQTLKEASEQNDRDAH